MEPDAGTNKIVRSIHNKNNLLKQVFETKLPLARRYGLSVRSVAFFTKAAPRRQSTLRAFARLALLFLAPVATALFLVCEFELVLFRTVVINTGPAILVRHVQIPRLRMYGLHAVR